MILPVYAEPTLALSGSSKAALADDERGRCPVAPDTRGPPPKRYRFFGRRRADFVD